METNSIKKIKIELAKSRENSSLHNVCLVNHYNETIAKLRIPDINTFLSMLHSEQVSLGRDKKDLIPVEYEEKGLSFLEFVNSIVSF